MVFNAFHVPLVDHNHDLLGVTVVDVGEEVFIPLVHEDLLQTREENVHALDIPVDERLIEALFGKGSRTSLSNLLVI